MCFGIGSVIVIIMTNDMSCHSIFANHTSYHHNYIDCAHAARSMLYPLHHPRYAHRQGPEVPPLTKFTTSIFLYLLKVHCIARFEWEHRKYLAASAEGGGECGSECWGVAQTSTGARAAAAAAATPIATAAAAAAAAAAYGDTSAWRFISGGNK